MKPLLHLAVQYAIKPETSPSRHQFRKWALAALEREAEIALRLVGSAESRELNRSYRGKDYATNVLTFTLNDDPLMGDIVLCAPIVEKEAAEQGKRVEAHYAHLLVHGLLHLQGYDHESAPEATLMEALETQIVMKLGYSAPYLITQDATFHG